MHGLGQLGSVRQDLGIQLMARIVNVGKFTLYSSHFGGRPTSGPGTMVGGAHGPARKQTKRCT